MRDPNDRYARESFTFRRMKPWQIGGILVGLVVLVFIVAALT